MWKHVKGIFFHTLEILYKIQVKLIFTNKIFYQYLTPQNIWIYNLLDKYKIKVSLDLDRHRLRSGSKVL